MVSYYGKDCMYVSWTWSVKVCCMTIIWTKYGKKQNGWHTLRPWIEHRSILSKIISRPLNSQYFFQLIAYFIFYWYFIGPKLPASFYVHRLCIPKIRSFWQIWIYKEICSASWILFCNASNKYYFYWSKWDQRFNMTLTALFSNVCLLFQNTWNVK